MSTRIQIRRDTAANWTSVNPVLAAGEQGFETDTGKVKIGTGSTAWTGLAYTAGGTTAASITDATSVGRSVLTATDAAAARTAIGATAVLVDGVAVSSLDVDSTPVTATSIGAVPASIVDAKGDLIVASAADTVVRKAVGTDGQLLAADSTVTGGIKWVNSPSGSFAKATDTDPYYAPQWPRFAGPAAPHLNNNQTTVGTNTIRACRVLIPRTGNLRDLTVWVQTQSGNFIAGVYDLGDTSSTVRTKLWDSGTVAVGAQGYQIIGDPNLAVTQGQMLDLAVITDNATVSLGHFAGFSVSARSNLPSAFLPTAGGCLPKLGWGNSPGSYALPSTISEGAASQSIQPIFIFGRIS